MNQYLRWSPETGRITGEMNYGKRNEDEERNEKAKEREAYGCKRRHENVEKESQKRLFKIMPKFIKQYQNIIHSNDAIKLGESEVEEATGKILAIYLNDIVETVMSTPDKAYLIQWAISELDDDEVKDAIKES
jgi:hypothetical protein